MPDIYWVNQARDEFEALPFRVQQEIERKLNHLRQYSGMYQRVETGEYAGCRRFLAGGRYHVYYIQYGPDEDCYIRAIVPARAEPR
jgi:hypothetical protein